MTRRIALATSLTLAACGGPQTGAQSQPPKRMGALAVVALPELAPTSTSTSTTVATEPEPPQPYTWEPPNELAGRVLACIRSYEVGSTAGGYATNTGNGYSGAYQWVPSTWRANAAAVVESRRVQAMPRWPENYVAQPAWQAPAAVQDEVAWWLWERRPSAWPSGNRHCHGPNPQAKAA